MELKISVRNRMENGGVCSGATRLFFVRPGVEQHFNEEQEGVCGRQKDPERAHPLHLRLYGQDMWFGTAGDPDEKHGDILVSYQWCYLGNNFK
eukprot:4557666-Amphidinium_carterae.1